MTALMVNRIIATGLRDLLEEHLECLCHLADCNFARANTRGSRRDARCLHGENRAEPDGVNENCDATARGQTHSDFRAGRKRP